jgi:hypothetical protein
MKLRSEEKGWKLAKFLRNKVYLKITKCSGTKDIGVIQYNELTL